MKNTILEKTDNIFQYEFFVRYKNTNRINNTGHTTAVSFENTATGKTISVQYEINCFPGIEIIQKGYKKRVRLNKQRRISPRAGIHATAWVNKG